MKCAMIYDFGVRLHSQRNRYDHVESRLDLGELTLRQQH